jgi:hypothetical protein
MRYLTVLGVGLLAMFGGMAFAITPASYAVVALPDTHVLSAETYPLRLSFSDNKPTAIKLSNAKGGKLEGTGLLLFSTTFGLAMPGSFEVSFLKVLEPKSIALCNSVGDPTGSGEVLVKGSLHIVPTTATGTPLAALELFAPFKIECEAGAKKFSIKGETLAEIKFKAGSTESESLTEGCVVATGNGAGKPNLSEYINDEDTKVKVQLLSELGSGEGESALEVRGEVCPEALGGKMFQVLQR